mmetsp:Transcript_85561/g.242657  ORF Transcript_85561/g.242657 Transcript_85561/m.242657 type:complete len:224 (+) Transcript_85561:81-752(+)
MVGLRRLEYCCCWENEESLEEVAHCISVHDDEATEKPPPKARRQLPGAYGGGPAAAATQEPRAAWADAGARVSSMRPAGTEPRTLWLPQVVQTVACTPCATMSCNTMLRYMQMDRVVSEFTVILDRTGGAPLGVDVDHTDDAHILIVRLTKGLVQTWNQYHPGLMVRHGDLITQVNNIRSVTWRMMIECKKHQILNLKIHRPMSPLRPSSASSRETASSGPCT